MRNTLVAPILALGAVLSPLVALAQTYETELSDVQGTWNNDRTGENITFNGRNVMDSRFGQGRVREEDDYGANFRITYQGNVKCYYYITMTSSRRLNFAVRNPDQSHRYCMTGPANREYAPPSQRY